MHRFTTVKHSAPMVQGDFIDCVFDDHDPSARDRQVAKWVEIICTAAGEISDPPLERKYKRQAVFFKDGRRYKIAVKGGIGNRRPARRVPWATHGRGPGVEIVEQIRERRADGRRRWRNGAVFATVVSTKQAHETAKMLRERFGDLFR